MIPARYSATRFPGKLMKDLGGKSVILRTYEAAVKTNLFDDVFVVTDSDLIFNEIITNVTKIIKKEAIKSDFVVDPFDKKEINMIFEKAEGQIKNLYQFAFFSIKEVKVGFEKRHESLREQMNEVKEKLNIILEFIKKNDK